jgi:hypothetical protein
MAQQQLERWGGYHWALPDVAELPRLAAASSRKFITRRGTSEADVRIGA